MKKIVMITAYDYPTAKIVEAVGVDYILVGDSLAMVVLGHKDTKSITLSEMLMHTRAVARGAKSTFVVGDMPIGSYRTPRQAMVNAKRFIRAGARGVKIEGNNFAVVKALLHEKIPVMGHLGLLPQTAAVYRVQGRDKKGANKIVQDAISLDKLGVFGLVLECIPTDLARRITQEIKAPTIGIGAGPYCNGQVLVLHYVLGLSDFQGRFTKQYGNVKKAMSNAIADFKKDVLSRRFPDKNHSFS